MKIIKWVGIGLVSLLAFLLLLALFIPKHYTVSVSTKINKPRQMVYEYVRLLDNQKKWSVWVKQDPKLNPTIIGIDGTVGAIQRWDSQDDNVGAGEQKITALSLDRMDVDLHFFRPFEGTAKAANIFKALGPNETELTIEFYSNDKYPFNLMSYFIGRRVISKASEDNCANLKKILESN